VPHEAGQVDARPPCFNSLPETTQIIPVDGYLVQIDAEVPRHAQMEFLPVLIRNRELGHAAVPHELRRDPLLQGAPRVVVLQYRPVRVRVGIDEAGRDEEPLHIYRALRLRPRKVSECDDLPILDPHIGLEPGIAGSIHNLPASQYDVVHH